MLKSIKSIFNRLEKLIFTRSAYKFIVKDWIELSDLSASSDVLRTMRFTQNVEPILSDIESKKRILVIAPHPDDEMIGPGGTLIKAIRKGCKVKTLYLTSGGRTGDDNRERENEANLVAKKIGYQTEFLRQSTLDISLNTSIYKELSQIITSFSPDIIFVTFLLDDHDDHRRASELLFRTYEEENLNDSIPVWSYQVYGSVLPNVIVDISEVSESKIEAIKLFTSQMKSRDWAHYSLGLNAYNSRLIKGKTTPRYVEAFFVLPLKDYAGLCRKYFLQGKNTAYYSEKYKNH